MKTLKFFFALGTALILFAGINPATAGEKPGNPALDQRTAKMVQYIVRVDNAGYVALFGRNVVVMLTDENGALVAPPQAFRPGTTDYIFYEAGTIRATRVARLDQPRASSNQLLAFPVSRTEIFYGGMSYFFLIRPVAAEKEPVKHIQ